MSHGAPLLAADELETIVRASFDGLFVADGQGTTLFVNAAFERHYGLKAGDLIGHPVAEFERRGWIRPVIAERVAQGRRRVTTTQTTHEGRVMLVTGLPLFDDAGRVHRVVINARALSELVATPAAGAPPPSTLPSTPPPPPARASGLLPHSPAMRRVLALATRVAAFDTTVLVQGETGVGKEVLAGRIHAESPRAGGPFVKINCGALPRDLLESELFGYEPGAFTGAQRQGKPGLVETAHGGTLFLDEIGELPPDLQAKLLAVLQDREVMRLGSTRALPVDVRVIAATHRNLQAAVAQQRFRADLYYRLHVVPLRLPSLAERPDDIVPLAQQFLAEFCRHHGVQRAWAEPVLQHLRHHPWPGNVRELRNVVERLVVTAAQPLIDVDDLDGVLDVPPPADGEGGGDDNGDIGDGALRQRLERFERELIDQAMRRHGSTRAAARALGVSQSSIVRKLRR